MSFMSFASEMLGNLFKPPATSHRPGQGHQRYQQLYFLWYVHAELSVRCHYGGPECPYLED